MNATDPIKEPISQSSFNGYWIPRHSAKAIQAGIDANSAPFLPDAAGSITAEPIYNGNTGFCLNAKDLIPAQIAKAEKGFESNVVGTKTTMDNAATSIKAGEKGLWYNFKNQTGEIHTSCYFFPEQAENPERLIGFASGKIKDTRLLQNETISVTDAADYLPAYLAACKSGIKMEVTPEATEAFKKFMADVCRNELASPRYKNPDIAPLNEILFDADKKSFELVKSIAEEKGLLKPKGNEQKVPEKKKEMEMER